MGRDNQPKHRSLRQLERKQSRRDPYDRILIVSEGSKTEPLYFGEIRKQHRLHTANVVVRPSELGTAPIQVVEFAHQLFTHGDSHRGIQPRAFEKVYAVFDRDSHDSYFGALKLAASLNGSLRNDTGNQVVFEAVASIPNFELWLLLHYEDVLAPIHRDEVIRRLKVHIPGYEKGGGGVYAITSERLPDAIQRAEHLKGMYTQQTDPQPYTDIVDLVNLLTKLRTPKS